MNRYYALTLTFLMGGYLYAMQEQEKFYPSISPEIRACILKSISRAPLSRVLAGKGTPLDLQNNEFIRDLIEEFNPKTKITINTYDQENIQAIVRSNAAYRNSLNYYQEKNFNSDFKELSNRTIHIYCQEKEK